MIEPFELFAVRYGTNSGRKASDNFIGADLHDEASDLDYFVWVARRSDRTFLIDTGFGEEAAKRRNRTLLRRPSSLLLDLGLKASSIDDVILTHLHFDHAGTLEDYPRAKLHIQDSEVSYATGRCMCHNALSHPYDVDDVTSFVRCVFHGRVHFHRGSEALADGLWVHHIGGHSEGLQVVRVWTARGWVVIASDASHLYANMEERRPFPIASNFRKMLEGFNTLNQLADSPDHIIPGHDPSVMSRYSAPNLDLEGSIVRLDVFPRR